MISVFDIEQLQTLLRDFYRITHIRITVFNENMKELVSYPIKIAPYCEVIRKTVAGQNACIMSDCTACRIAAKKRSIVHVYQCHAGFTEAVTPLYVGDILVGYLLFGHVFSYSSYEDGWRVIEKSCEELQVDTEKLKKCVLEAEPISEGYIRSAARILHAVASYLIMQRMATLKSDELAVKLDSYVSQHSFEKLTADELCSELKIGKTQLYRLSKELYNCGIAEHIRGIRIEAAKNLLLHDRDLSIAEVCERCGFGDYNYFITVFKKETGVPPSKWRNSQAITLFDH